MSFGRKLLRTLLIMFILIGTTALAFQPQRAKAIAAITILPDGTIQPTEANITTTDGVVYTFTNDNVASLSVQRNNTIINGAGYSLLGDHTSDGITLSNVTNVTITSVTVAGFINGIDATYTSDSTISDCTIKDNLYGIHLTSSISNSIYGNEIASNAKAGIFLVLYSSYNLLFWNTVENNSNAGFLLQYAFSNVITANDILNNRNGTLSAFSNSNHIFHNNVINNTEQALSYGSANHWDDDYPSGGNYWSDYSGSDSNRDAIGDTPYNIVVGQADRYPLAGPSRSFNTSANLFVDVVSNSSILSFARLHAPGNSSIRIRLDRSSLIQGNGFMRVCIPKSLAKPPYEVTIDGSFAKLIYISYDLYDNGTHVWVYFLYMPESYEIMITSGFNPPTIVMLSPQNKSYAASSIPLSFTIDQTPSWIGYSLDGQANVTLSGNSTLNGLSDGGHSVIVCANGTLGAMNSSSTVHFLIDTIPPFISTVTQSPPIDSVIADVQVAVNATVTDSLSGVKQVYLNYTTDNEAWIISGMTNLGGNVWSGMIPGLPYGTNVTYVVTAEDNAGSFVTFPLIGFEYQYHVIPEYTALMILSLLVLAALTTIAIHRKKRPP